MRKKVSIVWVLVVIMVLSMVGCRNTSNAIVETTSADENGVYKLEFKTKGTYIIEAFGIKYDIYWFDVPNERIVVYKTIDGIYLVGEYAENKGVSYGNIFMPEGEFAALSNKYLLFEMPEGKFAVALEKKKNVDIGESFYELYAFEELSEEDKNAFIYPIKCEKVEK